MQGTWALTIRSLRQDNRLIRYHLLRFAVAGLLAFIVLVMWLSGLQGESPGHDLLSMLAYANLFAVTIVGGFLFAPTITEEKEEQTLGLLRMTHIGPSALILGKSFPKLVLIALILIVQMPLLFLTRTLGGVDWPLITNVYLLIFCQLIGVVSISMLASVVMRTSTGAVVLTGLLLFFWFIIALVIEDAQRSTAALSTLEVLVLNGLIPLSPISQMDRILQTGANVGGTFPTCIAVSLMSAACYLFSVLTFSYWNTQESTQTESELLRERLGRIWHSLTGRARHRRVSPASASASSASPAPEIASAKTACLAPTEPPTTKVEVTPVEEETKTGRTRTSHACWQHAIAWKDYFLIGGGRTGLRTRCVIAIVFVVYALLSLSTSLLHPLMLGTFTYTPISSLTSGWGESIAINSVYAFVLDLVYLTVNLFSRELKQQTWESLLILPQSLGSICRQKIWGAAVHLTPWVACFVIGLVMTISANDVGSFIGDVFNTPLVSCLVILHGVTMLATVFLMVTWLSLRLNPWVTILVTWFMYWGVGILYMITFFMAFGFMTGPGPIEQQVLFNVGWITTGAVTTYLLWRSIRSTLQGEASAI
ncbi:MAG: hypothetical protein U0929_15975 [Planctomycetaceae bacterium]